MISLGKLIDHKNVNFSWKCEMLKNKNAYSTISNTNYFSQLVYITVETIIYMGTRDLPDIYAQSPQACSPWASGIHISKCTCFN